VTSRHDRDNNAVVIKLNTETMRASFNTLRRTAELERPLRAPGCSTIRIWDHDAGIWL